MVRCGRCSAPPHVEAKDIEFSELSMQPVYPPKQLLRFTLENVRYTVEVQVTVRTPWSWPWPPRRYPMELRSP